MNQLKYNLVIFDGTLSIKIIMTNCQFLDMNKGFKQKSMKKT